ncbi:MAG: hydrogenase maturation nickel metallochaperone HypA [Anaerolineae bacterium]|nr:hydrogenase maturation nickel metallochaperone HypA [Anaerolineae bacterium]
MALKGRGNGVIAVDVVLPEREEVRAMLEQAVAYAEARGGGQIRRLHVELFSAEPEVERTLCDLVREMSAGTLVDGTQVVTFLAPSRFICWNCCGLRFESEDQEAICPNCGELGMLVPIDVTFALDRVET